MNKNKHLWRSGGPEHSAAAQNTAGDPNAAQAEHLAAFARRLGVNRSTVTRAAQAGRLVMTADNRVLVAASLARWHATTGTRADVAARHAAARGAAVEPGARALHVASAGNPATSAATLASPAPQTDQQGAFPGSGGPNDAEAPPEPTADVSGAQRAAAEAERLTWQNALLGLSLELTRGGRIPRAAMSREAQGLGNALRAAVERLIDQTAPRLAAAAASPAEQRSLLRGELAAVRRQLLGEFSRAMRRLRPDGSVSMLGAAASTAAAEAQPEGFT